MIEFGSTLRAAREAKGYTVTQIAEITHIAPSTVAELENEDFRRIPAPIYGRGFVKLYCNAVGLDAKSMVDEFMEIFSGNHDTGIKERPVKEEVEAEPTPAPTPTPTPAPTPTPTPTPTPAPTPTPPDDLFAQATEAIPPASGENDDHSFSRYAAPIRTYGNRPTIPPAFWRMSLLALGGLILLALIYLGLSSLHSAVSGSPSAIEPAPVADAKDADPDAPRQPSAPRTPQKIPALYID